MTRTFFVLQDSDTQALANPVKVFLYCCKCLPINDLRAQGARPRNYIINNYLCQTKFNLKLLLLYSLTFLLAYKEASTSHNLALVPMLYFLIFLIP